MHPLHAIACNAQLFELVTEELAIQCEEDLLGDADDLLQVACLVVGIWSLHTFCHPLAPSTSERMLSTASFRRLLALLDHLLAD